MCVSFVFFFQAEDGIRDIGVTGVQTCALSDLDDPARRVAAAARVRGARLPTPARPRGVLLPLPLHRRRPVPGARDLRRPQIGRASCRERVEISVVAVSLKKKKTEEKCRWIDHK